MEIYNNQNCSLGGLWTSLFHCMFPAHSLLFRGTGAGTQAEAEAEAGTKVETRKQVTYCFVLFFNLWFAYLSFLYHLKPAV